MPIRLLAGRKRPVQVVGDAVIESTDRRGTAAADERQTIGETAANDAGSGVKACTGKRRATR